MKAMKKVAVTPVAVNNGTIIDSMITTDDHHTNAPSINAVEGYAHRKILHGTAVPTTDLGVDGDIYLQHG